MKEHNVTDADFLNKAKSRGARIMNAAVVVSPDNQKGTHDAHFVIADGYAYIVYEANDNREGENAVWHDIYCSMSMVRLSDMKFVEALKISESEQAFANETLLPGATFVPRVMRKDEKTLRVFFASTDPGVRQELTYYRDFDIQAKTWSNEVGRLKMRTHDGAVRDFTPKEYYDHAIESGCRVAYERDDGAYLFDIFDIGGQMYIALNNFAAKQVSLATINTDLDCIDIVSHIADTSPEMQLSEQGIARLPGGEWMAIMRDDKNMNYMFSRSTDGKKWSKPTYCDFVTTGCNSKPTLNVFGEHILMGWNDTSRKRFRLQHSYDGKNWTDIVDFCADTSFQYPTFALHDGEIYYSATIGNKQKIIFGSTGIKIGQSGKLITDDGIEY